MKLLMTTDNVGGVWTYSLELAGELGDRGHDVHLATMGRRLSAEQRRQVGALKGVTLHPSAYRLEWMNDPWDDIRRAGRWLMDLAECVEPDVVHLNGYTHGTLPWGCPVVVVGHSCVLSWWQAVKGTAAPQVWSRYRTRVRDGIHAADWVVAPTYTMLAALERHYGPLTRSSVIPNGRRPDDFRPATKEPFVFSAGRLWDEGKNLTVLCRAAPRVRWPIIIAGVGDGVTATTPVPGRPMLLQWLSSAQMAAWLGRAAIYAHPARYEPFGLAPLEAALAGCALVLGDIPSLREVWDDCALYADPEDPGALAEQLRRLASDAPLRRQMASRGRRLALQYGPSRVAHRYEALYRKLCGQASADTEVEAGAAEVAGLST